MCHALYVQDALMWLLCTFQELIDLPQAVREKEGEGFFGMVLQAGGACRHSEQTTTEHSTTCSTMCACVVCACGVCVVCVCACVRACVCEVCCVVCTHVQM